MEGMLKIIAAMKTIPPSEGAKATCTKPWTGPREHWRLTAPTALERTPKQEETKLFAALANCNPRTLEKRAIGMILGQDKLEGRGPA